MAATRLSQSHATNSRLGSIPIDLILSNGAMACFSSAVHCSYASIQPVRTSRMVPGFKVVPCACNAPCNSASE